MPEPTTPSSLRVDRFMRLPRRTGEVWQGCGVLLPFFAPDADTGEPVRQAAIAWANLATDDVLLVSATSAEAKDPASIMEAFLDFGLKARKVREGRPARIEVRDEALGAFIKDVLGDRELEVAVLPTLSRIDEEVDRLVRSETDDVTMPGVLAAPGVDENRLGAFADAASRCHARQIWHDIGPDDLVLVELPAPPEGMAGFAADAGGGEPRFDFYTSRQEFDRLRGDEEDDDGAGPDNDPSGWRAEFVRLHELPVPDVAPWADLGLRVAGPDAYPVVAKLVGDGEFVRPDAARLAFLEGLFRALAGTTEEEIDSGRWRRAVQTADGEVTYQLAIPSLLDEPEAGKPGRDEAEEAGARLSRFLEEGQFETIDDAIAELERGGRGRLEHPAPTNDEERAQELVYRSVLASGRRRTQLLRHAVAVSPDCYQAYLYLAEHATQPRQSLDLFERGRAAAERTLGRERLDELKGRCWEDRQARSYLRLRLGLALALRSAGRREEAAAELREVIALDGPDRSGGRDYLLALLLALGRDDEAAQLLDRFVDGGAAWMYGSALLAFRRGSLRVASGRLADAYAASPFSGKVLLVETLGPNRAADISPVDADVSHEESDEADECLDLLEEPWLRTPGALDWMARELTRLQRRRERRARARHRGRR